MGTRWVSVLSAGPLRPSLTQEDPVTPVSSPDPWAGVWLSQDAPLPTCPVGARGAELTPEERREWEFTENDPMGSHDSVGGWCHWGEQAGGGSRMGKQVLGTSAQDSVTKWFMPATNSCPRSRTHLPALRANSFSERSYLSSSSWNIPPKDKQYLQSKGKEDISSKEATKKILLKRIHQKKEKDKNLRNVSVANPHEKRTQRCKERAGWDGNGGCAGSLRSSWGSPSALHASKLRLYIWEADSAGLADHEGERWLSRLPLGRTQTSWREPGWVHTRMLLGRAQGPLKKNIEHAAKTLGTAKVRDRDGDQNQVV